MANSRPRSRWDSRPFSVEVAVDNRGARRSRSPVDRRGPIHLHDPVRINHDVRERWQPQNHLQQHQQQPLMHQQQQQPQQQQQHQYQQAPDGYRGAAETVEFIYVPLPLEERYCYPRTFGANDVEIIVIGSEAKYAEMILRRLYERCITASILFRTDYSSLDNSVTELGRCGTPYVIVLQEHHDDSRTISVNVFESPEKQREHHNLKIHEGVDLIHRHFRDHYPLLARLRDIEFRGSGFYPAASLEVARTFARVTETRGVPTASLNEAIRHLEELRDRTATQEGIEPSAAVPVPYRPAALSVAQLGPPLQPVAQQQPPQPTADLSSALLGALNDRASETVGNDDAIRQSVLGLLRATALVAGLAAPGTGHQSGNPVSNNAPQQSCNPFGSIFAAAAAFNAPPPNNNSSSAPNRFSSSGFAPAPSNVSLQTPPVNNSESSRYSAQGQQQHHSFNQIAQPVDRSFHSGPETHHGPPPANNGCHSLTSGFGAPNNLQTAENKGSSRFIPRNQSGIAAPFPQKPQQEYGMQQRAPSPVEVKKEPPKIFSTGNWKLLTEDPFKPRPLPKFEHPKVGDGDRRSGGSSQCESPWDEIKVCPKYTGTVVIDNQYMKIAYEGFLPINRWNVFAPLVVSTFFTQVNAKGLPYGNIDVKKYDKSYVEIDLSLDPDTPMFWNALLLTIHEFEINRSKDRDGTIWDRYYALFYWGTVTFATGFADFLLGLGISDDDFCACVCGKTFCVKFRPDAKDLYCNVLFSCLIKTRLEAARLVLARLGLAKHFPESRFDEYSKIRKTDWLKLWNDLMKKEEICLKKRVKPNATVSCGFEKKHSIRASHLKEHLEDMHPGMARQGWKACSLDERCIYDSRDDGSNHILRCPYRVRPLFEYITADDLSDPDREVKGAIPRSHLRRAAA